jgi:hypothetical protein
MAMPKLAAPNQENLGKAGGQDVQRGHEPVTGQPSHHKELASEAVRESSEKRLNQKLTDGKPGDDQPKLEVGSSFLGDVDGKKGNDEPPPMTTTVPARATRINSFRTLKIIWNSLEFLT